MHDALILVRFVHFAALMAVFGGTAMRFYGLGGAPAPADELAAFERFLAWLTGTGAIVALASGLGLVPCAAAVMTGSAHRALDPATLGAVLFATEFGEVWCWHLVLLLLLLAAAALPLRWRFATVFALAALSLGSLGWVGHAAEQSGWLGIAHKLNHSLHLLAAGLWLGGLAPLSWLLRRALRDRGGGFDLLARQALPFFSQMGYAAVGLLAVTGIANSAILVGSLGALFGTAYGRLLALKILLYLAMVALALRNRFSLTPWLLHEPAEVKPVRALVRSVAVEQALGLAILIAVSILGTWPPAASRP